MGSVLVLYVFLQDLNRRTTHATGEVAGRPKDVARPSHRPELASLGELIHQLPAGSTLQDVNDGRDAVLRWVLDQEVYMVSLSVELDQFAAEVPHNSNEHPAHEVEIFVVEHPPPALRNEYQVSLETVNRVPSLV